MSVIHLPVSNRNARSVAIAQDYSEMPFEQMRWGQLAAILGFSTLLWSILIAGGWSLYRLFA